MKRIFSLVLSLMLSVTMLVSINIRAEELRVVNVLHTNDVHGRIYQVDGNNTSMIGIDKLATLRVANNGILVDVGDAIHGLPIANMNKGYDVVELMAMAGYEVMTPGNHDFNFGSARLKELAEMALPKGLTIISSNIVNRSDSSPFLPTTKIIERNGVKVGFFGLTTTDTPLVTSPLNVETLLFNAYVSATQQAITTLKSNGATVIVGMMHVSRSEIKTLLGSLSTKPDVVLDGHDHLVTNEIYNGTLIAGAGQYEENLGKVAITVDANGVMVSATASLINKPSTTSVIGDPTVKAKAELLKSAVLAEYSSVVAQSEVLLSSARGTTTVNGVRNSEQALGNLVTDAMLWASGADFAFTNGGGLRTDLKPGAITRGNIISILPFGNVLVVKEITPEQLKTLLEYGYGDMPNPQGRFPHIAGLAVDYAKFMPAGQRVVGLSINGLVLDLNDNTTMLKMATNDFLAAGGDGYTLLKSLKTTLEGDSLDLILERYIKSLPNQTVTSDIAHIEGRLGFVTELVVDKVITGNQQVWVTDSMLTPTGTGFYVLKNGYNYLDINFAQQKVHIRSLADDELVSLSIGYRSAGRVTYLTKPFVVQPKK
jgi:2',3'-cyclic-nucleotide 2'-phosphodiesterase (5'-nucleotidase family)